MPSDEKYIEYANFSRRPDAFKRRYRSQAFNEFSASLHDSTLDSNDVDGILKLSESAHIPLKLLSGPYSGLYQDQSAVSVTRVIHEQVKYFAELLFLRCIICLNKFYRNFIILSFLILFYS